MKRKAQFLSATANRLARTRDGWQILDGLPENNHGWFVYLCNDGSLPQWWLIEGRTGAAVGIGATIDAACRSFTANPERMMTWCARAANEPPVDSLRRLEGAES